MLRTSTRRERVLRHVKRLNHVGISGPGGVFQVRDWAGAWKDVSKRLQFRIERADGPVVLDRGPRGGGAEHERENSTKHGGNMGGLESLHASYRIGRRIGRERRRKRRSRFGVLASQFAFKFGSRF